jgi:hypothetical protein
MVNISSFYCHYKTDPIKFTFIQYENYIKVLLNKRQIILTNMQLVSNPELFQFFKLSLLCTENTSRIYFDRISTPNGRISIYGTFTQTFWKNKSYTDNYSFVKFEKSPRNPLLSKEPNRSSGEKKIKKFMKLFEENSKRMKDVNVLICEYLETYDMSELMGYFNNYIQHNKGEPKIIGLSMILHNYGPDVYNSIRQHLY